MAAQAPDGSGGTVEPTVTVRGEAAIRVEPDEAVLAIALSALKEDPASALADVSERSDLLVTILDDLGVPRADRSTSGVSLREEFDHTTEGRRSLGHRAVANTVVRTADPATIGRLVTVTATELRAQLAGPRWRIAPGNPARLEVARQASAEATRKARAFADGVGAKLGRLVRLAEPNEPERQIARSASLMQMAAGGEMPINPGELEVAAVIEATFILELG
jgi:uncharacterized protein YggE